MVSRTLHVTFTMMPEMFERLEESKPEDITMDQYIRETLKAEIDDTGAHRDTQTTDES
ncbi:hypothetical protein [Haloarcula argentinensis]|uniref:CopG family transcriptional regulator n=1 Tax=Haloarcula argentinensis TaxID=43776 RepID=A0A847UR15_HALAR|nr:hypothetical protein [Haloarcula argentinensis]NLV15197.1 hypothetical protein [Haloarcula argentinensis]